MSLRVFRQSRVTTVMLLVFGLLLASSLVACKSAGTEPAPKDEAKLLSYKVGTLQTDDLLPLWVAEKENFLKDKGIEAEIISFQSAQEQIAAMVAGEIDGMMTDMVVPTQLVASGTSVKAVTVMQGAPAGILVNPKSGITDIASLKGKSFGNSSNTVLEYIVDKLLEKQGLAKADLKFEEIKKLPVRFEMLSSGQIDAAALPWTFFEIGRGAGLTPLADHADVDTLTSTVLVFSEKFLAQEGADETIKASLEAWDEAVSVINTNPDGQRALLAEKTKLPEQLAASYPVRQYPNSAAASTEQFEDIISWMKAKGYIEADVSASDLIY